MTFDASPELRPVAPAPESDEAELSLNFTPSDEFWVENILFLSPTVI